MLYETEYVKAIKEIKTYRYTKDALIIELFNIFKRYDEYDRKSGYIEEKEIGPLCNFEIIRYYDLEGNTGYDYGNNLFCPSEEFSVLFVNMPNIRFVSVEYYDSMIADKTNFKEFLQEAGVHFSIELYDREVKWEEARKRKDLPYERSTGGDTWIETTIAGCNQMLDVIVNDKNKSVSVKLWNALVELCKKEHIHSMEYVLTGKYSYYYYCWRYMNFQSSIFKRLYTEKWLVDCLGFFCSPKDLTAGSMAAEYCINDADVLMKGLGISTDKNEKLTEYQLRLLKFGLTLEEAGITEEDLPNLIFLHKQFKEWKNSVEKKQ